MTSRMRGGPGVWAWCVAAAAFTAGQAGAMEPRCTCIASWRGSRTVLSGRALGCALIAVDGGKRASSAGVSLVDGRHRYHIDPG